MPDVKANDADDAKTPPDADDAPKAAKRDAAKATIAADQFGNATRDFTDYASAVAQAEAIGKGATVEHVGVAFHVADKAE